MSLELEREEVVQRLCTHYAHDHLSTGELEARFELAYQATDRSALRTVLVGLPALGPTVAPPAPLYDVAGPVTIPGASDEKRYAAFLAEIVKEGQWLPAPRIKAKAILGTVKLDFREAAIPVEGIDIDVDALLGEVVILLPPGIGADVDCTAMLAEVKDKAKAGTPGAPRVRVRGGAVLGTISVTTKLPKPARMEGWRTQFKALLRGGD